MEKGTKIYLNESSDDFVNRDYFTADIAIEHVNFLKTKLRLGRFKNEWGIKLTCIIKSCSIENVPKIITYTIVLKEIYDNDSKSFQVFNNDLLELYNSGKLKKGIFIKTVQCYRNRKHKTVGAGENYFIDLYGKSHTITNNLKF